MAEKVEVTANSMKAEELKKKVYFMGNVHIKQGESWLHGEKVIVHFNDNNETDQYEAIENVRFEFRDEKNHYKGKAEHVIYYPPKAQYLLKGKAVIEDLANNRVLKGEEIMLDMKTGNASVKGNRKKPVKFIFDMEKQ
jgi:lipopolysaccharide export system protein LptA